MNLQVVRIFLVLLSFLFGTEWLRAQNAVEDVLSRPRFIPIPQSLGGKTVSIVLLDGVWRINPKPGQDAKSETTSGAGWFDFTVPGQWAQQGFDIHNDSQAVIARDFKVPASWTGKRVMLRFDAVHGGTDYWLNGKHLGYSENLFTPVEFDITDKIQANGNNHLALNIKLQTKSEKLSLASSYAHHSLGGIDRSVRLYALPASHIASFRYQTLLDSNYRHASLVLNMKVQSNLGKGTLRVSLADPKGKKIVLAGNEIKFGSTDANEISIEKKFFVSDPLKWSAEKPFLYRLVVELLNAGKVEHQVEQHVGFRELEVRGSELLVNGKAVKLAGACRHEIDPLTGRAGTAKYAKEDARIFKDANFNFIRTAHYPPTKEFLEECDRIGMYVECETPMVWMRTKEKNDPAFTEAFLVPVAAMIDYHGNSPSVILWSIGNESGGGPDSADVLAPNFLKSLEVCRKLDPTRPVIFDNEWNKDGGSCDIACLHYPPFPFEEWSFVKDETRPVLLDEYFPPQTWHLAEQRLNPGLDIMWTMGENSDTSWWNHLYNSKMALGGTIWAAIDEEFYFKDGRTSGMGPYVGYGPWGFVDAWRRQKSVWWDAKLMFSPVWVPVRTVPLNAGNKIVQIPIENRYSFTNLNEISITWQIGAQSGKSSIDLPPKSKGEVQVPIPAGTADGELLVLRFLDKQNQLISTHAVRLGERKIQAIPQVDGGAPDYKEDGNLITVSGKGFTFSIDRASGKITPAGKNPFPLQSFPVFFCGLREKKTPFNYKGIPYAEFPDKNNARIDSVWVEKRTNALSVTFKTRDSLFSGQVELLIDKNGQATASYDYLNNAAEFDLGEIGLQFTMDSSCQKIVWDRQSEWEVYPDDNIGRAKGYATAHAKENSRNEAPPYLSKPTWKWYHDDSEFGTVDFRASKYQIYEAKLINQQGAGIMALSNAQADVRACLSGSAVLFHLLEKNRYPKLYLEMDRPGELANNERKLMKGERLKGSFTIRFLQ